MVHQPTAKDEQEQQIIQDFYDRLAAEDLSFYEALSALDQVREKIEAKMHHRHINDPE